ncbi:MAG TPA: hypothetical protein PLL72_20235, partial [Burkholderiaceae bacterium]|nr:hypothetical protein [Burkholderiaceae bacterium]
MRAKAGGTSIARGAEADEFTAADASAEALDPAGNAVGPAAAGPACGGVGACRTVGSGAASIAPGSVGGS